MVCDPLILTAYEVVHLLGELNRLALEDSAGRGATRSTRGKAVFRRGAGNAASSRRVALWYSPARPQAGTFGRAGPADRASSFIGDWPQSSMFFSPRASHRPVFRKPTRQAQPALTDNMAVRLLHANDDQPCVQELQLLVPEVWPHTCALHAFQILTQRGADRLPCLSGCTG